MSSGVKRSREIARARDLIEAVMGRLTSERDSLRAAVKGRGRPKRAFLDDPDRFALAMISWILAQNAEEPTEHRQSTYQAAWHAAAHLAPGNRSIEWAFRSEDGGLVKARPLMSTASDHPADHAHDDRATYLERKFNKAAGVELFWVHASGKFMRQAAELRQRPYRARYALGMLSLLGWDELPAERGYKFLTTFLGPDKLDPAGSRS